MVRASDRTGLVLRRWKPASSTGGRVVIVHGLSEHGGRYDHVASALRDRGFEVLIPDHRGHGLSGGTRGHVDRFERFLDDLELVLDQPSSHRPVLLGHSLGGLIALDYVLDQRSRPSALVLSAPVLDLAVPAWKRAAARVAGRVLPRIRFPNAIRGDQLSRDPAVGERYLADRLVGRHTSAGLGVEMLEAMSRVRRRADRLPVPTLVLHGGDDSLVPPEATAWLADLDGVERLLYPSLRHELFNEPEWMQVLEDVLGWLRTH